MPIKASYEKLDHILSLLQYATQESPIDLMAIRLTDDQLKNVSNRDWDIMRRKLLKDDMIGFITRPIVPLHIGGPTQDLYFITFDGLMLLEMERGYEGRLAKKDSDDLRELSIKRTNSRITVIAVFVAFCSLIVSLFAYLHSTALYNQQPGKSETPILQIKEQAPDTVRLHQK